MDEFLDYRKVKWSEALKNRLRRGSEAEFDASHILVAQYRPFTRLQLYNHELMIDRPGLFRRIIRATKTAGRNEVICVPGVGNRQAFGSLIVRHAASYDLAFEKTQCFPFYVYDEGGGNRRENVTDWALQQFREHYGDKNISKWEIFHYTYSVLHHPGYREKFADNLKRELPRIPFAPDFRAFAAAGTELARLHLDYENLEPYPLEWLETPGVPLSYRVGNKMRLSKDKASLVVNPSLTLAGIPPETFRYRLGNRSALEWVIDQYQVSEDKRSGIESDPNRADDPEYIVRLVRQVVRVSLETLRIVAGLPEQYTE
jgi:predicted helicase